MITDIILSIILGWLCALVPLIAWTAFMPLVVMIKRHKISSLIPMIWIIQAILASITAFSVYAVLITRLGVDRPISGWAIGTFMFLYILNDFRRTMNPPAELKKGRELEFWGTTIGSLGFLIQILIFKF